MKQLLFSCLLFNIYLFSYSQIDSVLNRPVTRTSQTDYIINPIVPPAINKPVVPNAPPTQPKKPELFNSGFIDFQNSGQMNASARVFKIYIGEPKKFMLPISVYSGVSGNNYNTGNNISNRGSEQMILGLINPMSGVFNLSTDNTFRFNKKTKNLTGFSFVYQLGEKMITGQQAFTFKTFSFFSTYANSGLLFQTGAWEKDKEKNMGVFWLLFRYHVVNTSNTFQKLSGYPPDNKFFKGFSIGMGIEINNVLNIKSYYYRYINPGADIFDIPIYQLTFNYSMRN
ncbi:MAG TPA: hypothetical protein VGP43_09925 [Chitinophagaceae bacterium]|nr:hypothetical protein [Chitinophagaceae bacterium]